MPLFLEYHLKKRFKNLQIEVQANWTEIECLKIVEKDASDFIVYVVTKFEDLIHFVHPIFLNDAEPTKHLIVIGFIRGSEFIQYIT